MGQQQPAGALVGRDEVRRAEPGAGGEQPADHGVPFGDGRPLGGVDVDGQDPGDLVEHPGLVVDVPEQLDGHGTRHVAGLDARADGGLGLAVGDEGEVDVAAVAVDVDALAGDAQLRGRAGEAVRRGEIERSAGAQDGGGPHGTIIRAIPARW